MVRKENEVGGKWKSNMLAFSTTSFKEKVKDFSTTLNQESTYVGLILLVRYNNIQRMHLFFLFFNN